ncbi:hypothetical protein [Oceanibium sediminis]|uniref:hypothetical protein n=1 Tax=Oceanibium sediminis TaxID=2026339 RepID=UPI000DD32987|nr:hypothetical protein [Oceanibium sediminis]
MPKLTLEIAADLGRTVLPIVQAIQNEPRKGIELGGVEIKARDRYRDGMLGAASPFSRSCVFTPQNRQEQWVMTAAGNGKIHERDFVQLEQLHRIVSVSGAIDAV